MKAGDEEPIFGYIKESNVLEVDKKNQYENERTRLEEELYNHLLFNLIIPRSLLRGHSL
jgi:hypothetical protein